MLNLIYRTRLKLAASMLHFEGYSDFADYFGPRWNFYLREIIGAIPVPMVFAKGDFESGEAAKLLNDFAEDPYPYLEEKTKKKMMTVQTGLLRKFTELAFDETSAMRCQEAQRRKSDNIDVGPVTKDDLQLSLFASLVNPF